MEPMVTERLLIRSWSVDDAEPALAIYGAEDVTRWLTPVMERVSDLTTMRTVLRAWIEAQEDMLPPRGRWAVQRKDNGEVIGGLSIQLLPPFDEDLELSWQLRPQEWGQGYGLEAGEALIRWAFTQQVDELFAVARPRNTRAIGLARRLGMEWVGETTKYFGLRLQVFRIRPSDLQHPPA
jgi:RimJ/RimL family protein N-acetyltransferase